jgi:hypothetical protein
MREDDDLVAIVEELHQKHCFVKLLDLQIVLLKFLNSINGYLSTLNALRNLSKSIGNYNCLL